MTFISSGKFVDNTTKLTLLCICIALILICIKLMITPTTTLISENKRNHAANDGTRQTPMMNSISTQQSISTATMTSAMTPNISTSRPQTSTANSSMYWAIDSYFSLPRVLYDAVVFPNGSVIACGGFVNSTAVTASCSVYTSSINWMNGPPMNFARYGYTLTLFANKTKILAAGSGYSGYEQTAEVYDMANGRWTYTTMNMTASRYLHSAILLRNEQILLMGGIDRSNKPLSSAELFVPSSRSFIRTNSMKVARAFFTSTVLTDGLTVFITGGYSTNSTLTASAELYTSGSWAYTINNMTVPRSRHAAVLLQDGNVLIAGGDNGTHNSFASAEIYNAATRTFTAVGSMKYKRTGLTLTLLPSGKVLATGGFDWSTSMYPTICELYDPVTQRWSDTRALRSSRYLHISVLLNNSVLSMGGTDSENTVLGSCEKYYL